MPRKSPGEIRAHHVSFRLNVEEIIALRERAAQAGQSLSEYARRAALGIRPRAHSAFAFEPGTFLQIRMLGVNLNQIARRLNSTDMPAPPELQPLLAEIRAALARALPQP